MAAPRCVAGTADTTTRDAARGYHKKRMPITIKFFAAFRDVAGAADLSMNIADGATVADLIDRLERDFPKFGGKLTRLTLTAVNERYVPRQTALQANDVIALFPPVSGG